MTNLPPTVTTVPVPVEPIWKHWTAIFASVMAVIPLVIAVLDQLGDMPGLPTNLALWIGTAVSVLTAVVTIWQKLNGTIMITPTAAAKVTGGK